MHSTRPLSNRAQQVNLIHLLQRCAIPQTKRSRSTNHKHRAIGKISICHARHAIGNPRACRQKRNARFARTLRPPFSRVHRRLLVARIHHPNPLPHTPIVNSTNMPPAERKDDLNSFSLQYLSDQPASVHHPHTMPLSVFTTLTHTPTTLLISLFLL